MDIINSKEQALREYIINISNGEFDFNFNFETNLERILELFKNVQDPIIALNIIDKIIKTTGESKINYIDFYKNLIQIVIEQNNLELITTLFSKVTICFLKKGIEYQKFIDILNLSHLIHINVRKNNPIIIDYLISVGADINFQDKYIESPLHLAVRDGNEKIINFLVENKADLNIKNIKGDTPLHLAVENKNMETIICLISSGVELNNQNNEGNTLLHIATEKRSTDIIRSLIACGANTSIKNNKGDTPLHLAAKNDYKEILNLLIENEANTTIQNNKGNTPLHLAAKKGFSGIVFYLISSKTDSINIKNNKGKTPLHYAVERKNIEMIRTLLEIDKIIITDNELLNKIEEIAGDVKQIMDKVNIHRQKQTSNTLGKFGACFGNLFGGSKSSGKKV